MPIYPSKRSQPKRRQHPRRKTTPRRTKPNLRLRTRVAPYPRIILLDIETSPSLGWVWGKWQQNVIDFKTNWFLLSFAWKVLGESSIHFSALPDYSTFKKDRENDRLLVEDLWKVIELGRHHHRAQR